MLMGPQKKGWRSYHRNVASFYLFGGLSFVSLCAC